MLTKKFFCARILLIARHIQITAGYVQTIPVGLSRNSVDVPFFCKGGISMAWIYLLIAGILEMGWAVGLKYTHGFSNLVPSILTLISMAASFLFLSLALRDLPISMAYAIWTGIGIVGTVIAGLILFQETLTPWQSLSVVLIVAGLIGLRLTSGA